MSGATLQVVAPCAHGHDPVFDRYGDAGRFFRTKLSRIPGLDLLGLDAIGVYMLLKIALAMEE